MRRLGGGTVDANRCKTRRVWSRRKPGYAQIRPDGFDDANRCMQCDLSPTPARRATPPPLRGRGTSARYPDLPQQQLLLTTAQDTEHFTH